jgi:hypothetical protein
MFPEDIPRRRGTQIFSIAYCYLYSERWIYRTLQKKRHELTMLKEESDGLQAELKLRRRNLRSLEKSVKTALNAKGADDGQLAERSPPANLRLFVALPDGGCIEVLQPMECNVQSLEAIVRNTLQNSRFSIVATTSTFQFHYQGKLLLPTSTLKECGIVNNDSIMLTLSNNAPNQPQVQQSHFQSQAQSDQQLIVAKVSNDNQESIALLTDELRYLFQKYFTCICSDYISHNEQKVDANYGRNQNTGDTRIR